MGLNPAAAILGCYAKRADTRLESPGNTTTNTGTLQAKARPVDPLARRAATTFWLDRIGTFTSPALVTSAGVNGFGGVLASWSPTTPANGRWYWRARSTAAVGGAVGVTGRYASTFSFTEAGGAGIPRSLYLYENKGFQATTILARSLYLYENRGLQAISVVSRALYLYVNKGIQALTVLARALYLYEAKRDGEVFPWLMKIDPVEQYAGGQVDLYGDGFGELVEVAAGATISVDSANASYIAANAVDRSTGSWVSNGGAGAWIRFTFGAAKKIVAIALESAGNGWGVPLFGFSDGGADVNGGVAVPGGVSAIAEYPVGTTRALYTLPTPRTTTYVEIRIASGGSGTGGLYEVWIFEDLDDLAETSRVWLNFGQPAVTDLGIVLWANRSPNLYPANSGIPITKAATVTLPAAATSGLVIVREET
ncbi:MAG: hypothetical protein M0Z49_01030 [Chloroflexi bacterium]|nr:hypothetical protein [Chloroflexota bacterium]